MSLSQHIALVPEAGGVNASELARVCAALQKQLTRDVAPMWGISATINAFPHLEDVPLGYWPIIITFCELGDQAGVHIDKNGQPYAQVEMSPGWSLHASQACIDMLVNPFARKLVTGPSPRPDQGPVEFLLEVGAPCNDADSAYVIDDVLVSDFCTPAFWGSSSASNHSFSFTGALHTPHQVLPGGHLTWHDPITDKWWLRHHLDQTLVDTRLGTLDGRVGVVRETMRLRAPHALRAEKMSVAAFEARLGVRRQHALQASQFQAHRLRTLVIGTGSDTAPELEGRASINTVEIRNERHRRPLLTHPADAQGDEVVVEVTPNELLDETQLPPDVWSPPPPPADPARAHAVERPRTKTAPPPFPTEEPRPAAHVSQKADAPQVPVLQTPLPQAPIPRSAPLPPPRMPERSPISGSTMPPISMSGRSAAPPPPTSSNGWLLAASAIAGAATVLLAIILYGRASPSIDSSTSAPAHAAPLVAPTPVAPPAAPIVTASPSADPPEASRPLTRPSVTAVAIPATPPAAPPAATATAPAAPLAAPAPVPPAKVARPRTGAPAARPAPGAADDSDPLEGLIGERR